VQLLDAKFLPFKVWMMYKYRRGKLAAKGVQPTLKHLIFFRTALSRAVSLQPLVQSDWQEKLLEQEQRMKEQEQRMKEQERAIALQQQQSASSLRPRSDDA
jgi:hypothetical protein